MNLQCSHSESWGKRTPLALFAYLHRWGAHHLLRLLVLYCWIVAVVRMVIVLIF